MNLKEVVKKIYQDSPALNGSTLTDPFNSAFSVLNKSKSEEVSKLVRTVANSKVYTDQEKLAIIQHEILQNFSFDSYSFKGDLSKLPLIRKRKAPKKSLTLKSFYKASKLDYVQSIKIVGKTLEIRMSGFDIDFSQEELYENTSHNSVLQDTICDQFDEEVPDHKLEEIIGNNSDKNIMKVIDHTLIIPLKWLGDKTDSDIEICIRFEGKGIQTRNFYKGEFCDLQQIFHPHCYSYKLDENFENPIEPNYLTTAPSNLTVLCTGNSISQIRNSINNVDILSLCYTIRQILLGYNHISPYFNQVKTLFELECQGCKSSMMASQSYMYCKFCETCTEDMVGYMRLYEPKKLLDIQDILGCTKCKRNFHKNYISDCGCSHVPSQPPVSPN